MKESPNLLFVNTGKSKDMLTPSFDTNKTYIANEKVQVGHELYIKASVVMELLRRDNVDISSELEALLLQKKTQA